MRHHVNPLKQGYVGIAAERVPLPPPTIPVEVELGCADARFLFERAAQRPAATYIGLEIRREMVARVNQQAQQQGLANLRAVHANINTDLFGLFPRGRLQRIFINFPDPWFKRTQHKRRLMTLELATQLAALLTPDGELLFQSDVFDLALDAMAVLEQEPALRNVRGEWSFLPQNPYGVQSLREVRVQERGLPVWRMLYRRSGDEAAARAPG